MRTSLALGALALLAACAPDEAAATASTATATEDRPGEGLVILPYEDPTIGPIGAVDERLYFHDFGHVQRGEVVERVFRLENTDPVPVAIKRVVPSCGCTVPKLSYERDGEIVVGKIKPTAGENAIVVPPGQIVDLTLEIDTRQIKNVNVDKLLTATVTTDSPNSFYIPLEAHIYVERAFTIVPEVLNLGRLPENGGGEGSLQVVQSAGFEHRVTGVLESPPGFEAQLTLDDSLDRSLWTLSVRADPPVKLGRTSGKIILAAETVDGEALDPVVVPLIVDGVADIGADPSRLVFATTRGEEATGSGVVRTLLPGHHFAIKEARVAAEHSGLLQVAFEAVGAEPDGRSHAWRVSLKTVPPLPESSGELLSGEIELTLDDPQHPTVLLPYVIHLR